VKLYTHTHAYSVEPLVVLLCRSQLVLYKHILCSLVNTCWYYICRICIVPSSLEDFHVNIAAPKI